MTPSCFYLFIHWRFLVFGCCCFWLLSCTPASEDGGSSPPNILFISIDDLRPELPFAVPQRYWDRYEEEAIALAENPFLPVNGIGYHDWNLGEHTLWCKHSNYEVSTRTAMLMRIPGEQVPRQTDALCGLIDLYPTICDYAGLPRPAHVQGQSLRPILAGQQTTVQDRVFSLYFDS